ncbi:NADPH-dependent FMN reductase [Streptomyces sp. CB00455]|uniref:NADPH-dependent FMN reductase n=1 Tax=Streptomyces sp. CB00455 TaxID=1703927 RepID=UPI0009393A4A|nr:NAD(P)H-dependent oxidoreductase [Streptomyces sp. CB00455]OKK16304.1 NADPH-dependent FMN reductase [Streptomyces sp. CB00455]
MTAVSPQDRPEPLRILVLSASLRAESLNTRLALLAERLITGSGAVVDRASLRDFPLPPYDGDVEDADGVPATAADLGRRIAEAQAFLIAAPEYNASIPGALKNALDWVSRLRPQPFKDRHALLLSASPSLVGGNRGLWALRVPLEHLGTRVYPDMFSLAAAHQGFTDTGDLTDTGLQDRLAETLQTFLGLVEADTRYVCLERRWYEFLGDRTGAPVTQRAED